MKASSENANANQEGFATWPAWASSAKSLHPITAEQSKLYTVFKKWIQTHHNALWDGWDTLELSPRDHAELREKLLRCAPNHKSAEHLANWWDCLIAEGNIYKGWNIPLLQPVVELPAIKASFVRSDFQLLHTYRPLELAFVNRLKTGISPQDLQHAILVSAIICGGHTNTRTLRALGSWLDRPSAARSTARAGADGCIRVQIQVPDQGSTLIDQTWYPDAITGVLLTQWFANPPGSDHATTWSDSALGKRIAHSLTALKLPTMPFSELSRAARTSHALQLSPFLVRYLAGDISSQSLPNAVAQRLCGYEVDAPAIPSEGLLNEPVIQQFDLVSRFEPKQAAADQIAVIKEAIAILRDGSDVKQKLESLVERYRASLWPVTQLLCLWCSSRLKPIPTGDAPQAAAAQLQKEVLQGRFLVASSSIRYLQTLAEEIITTAGPEDILEFEADDFETLYELAAEQIKSDKERSYYWGRVADFHGYLMLYGAPPVDIAELDGFMSSVGTISANLIGEDDFVRFKSSLLSHPCAQGPCALGKSVLLAAILGYRCGLRRKEVQLLHWKNLHMGREPWLLVRASRLAALKSHASRRKLPLIGLLTSDELELLRQFHAHKGAQGGHARLLMFSMANTPYSPLSDQVLFKPITQGFQQILGPGLPTFRYHHLRHSFANWLMLAFLMADNPALWHAAGSMLRQSPYDPTRATNLKSVLFEQALGTAPTPTRRNLYLVSAMLGHLSPETTLHAYVHVLDWLSAQEANLALQSQLKAFQTQELTDLCCMQRSRAFREPFQPLTKTPLAFLSTYIFHHWPTSMLERPAKTCEPIDDLSAVFAPLCKPQIPSPARLMQALAALHFDALKQLASSSNHLQVSPSEKILAQLEKSLALPREAVLAAWHDYLQLYAQQSGSIPKRETPGPPRNQKDKPLFWQILQSTEVAYASKKLQPILLETAERLIKRQGPTAYVKLKLGRQVKHGEKMVLGLQAMGIPTDHIQPQNRPGPHNSLLDVVVAPPGQNEPIKSAGLLKGVNYAAVWVRFAQMITHSISTRAARHDIDLLGQGTASVGAT